ncbi:Ribonuclease H domain [Arabidopsis suecica]|uniref:Ribonuclease H domain n=1 Tax=Arabidopsis suecica TaxID=45249 RepID=A0A8T2BEP5_ARASU|nr:Ribonuclease H domain [Arabidopsis suecica]
MGKYLGLPESLGGSKTKIFSFVRERLNDRINGWSAKVLLKGGKEVMIKSVAAALPTYVMSCFRLPKSVTSKLTSAVAKFWWSSNGETRDLHWKAWDKLCRSKSDGGIGFRNVDDFNTALLAKQLLRLITVPDSLFAKVFKGRYYRNSNPMDPIRSYSPSYGWRSIVSARPLVNKGLIKRVGSGESISVWNDPWIPAQFSRPALSNSHNHDPTLLVKCLINSQTNSWDIELIRTLFDPKDIPMVCVLPLGLQNSPDVMEWHFTKTGKYTVKSGYYTEQMRKQDENQTRYFGPDIPPLQANSWKLQCPPKLRHFIWQVLSGCVPIHENIDRDPRDTLKLAESEANAWTLAQLEMVKDAPPRGSAESEVINTTGYRCFIEGSWKESDNYSGLGWFYTLQGEDEPTMGAANLRRSLTCLHTEVEALVWAMRCMIGQDKREVSFYTDCSDLVKMVSSPTEWPAFSTYLEAIQSDKDEFDFFSLSLISRRANSKADNLARNVRTQPHLITYVTNIPQNWLV